MFGIGEIFVEFVYFSAHFVIIFYSFGICFSMSLDAGGDFNPKFGIEIPTKGCVLAIALIG